MSTAADAFFAVSLAGSLFFNVSVDAAHSRVILYLLVTMAPFAVVAPLIGPVIDRVRSGQRLVVAFTCAGRAVVSFTMADDLRSLLLYPQAFLVLVLSKTYSVAKSALTPRLVEDPDELVTANSRLSRLSMLGGAAGGVLAAVVLNVASASWVLHAGAAVYLLAGMAAMRLPPPHPAPRVSRRLEYDELHAPDLMLAAAAMGILRGAVGYTFFLLAFALRATAEPSWFFATVLAASGVGALAGTFVAPWARRRLSEAKLLALSLAVPGALALIGAFSVGRMTILAVAFGLGLGANTGRQAFDALVQRHAPDADRGRMFARFETRFQLSWVLGALGPVAAQPPTPAGLLVLGAVLAVAAAAYATGRRRLLGVRATGLPASTPPVEDHEQPALDLQLLEAARLAAATGRCRQAVVHAASAAETALRGARNGAVPEDLEAWRELCALKEAALANGTLDPWDTQRAVALAQNLLKWSREEAARR